MITSKNISKFSSVKKTLPTICDENLNSKAIGYEVNCSLRKGAEGLQNSQTVSLKYTGTPLLRGKFMSKVDKLPSNGT